LFRGHRADSLYNEHLAEITRQGVAQDVIDRSKAYGDAVGAHVIGWMKGDGYVRITAMSRYVIPKGRGLWEPTEPDFKDPADPFWGDTMRTLTLATSGQFPCIKPHPFSDARNSEFYKQVQHVYEVSQNLTDEQRTIALYWNDNPVYSAHRGHMMYTIRWMTPPGHWINITAIAAKMKKLGMMESLETYTMVSLAMFDGFISCWHEKYRSNVMRPVTYIKRYIDSTWQPLIQTPPFPEHTSGHSTISAAAATVLTKLLGEFEFTDDTSTPLGFEPRTFKNFLEAAQEASMSRVYGGIHYVRGCDGGNRNGREIGAHVLEKVRTRM
jgi:PAP2 superfamily